MWQAMFDKAGRSDDLLVFGPDTPLRFNFLGLCPGDGGQTRDVTRCITVISARPSGPPTRRAARVRLLGAEQERMIYNAVETVKQAEGSVSAPMIQKFINSAPTSLEQIASPQWQAGYCNQCLAKRSPSRNRRSKAMIINCYGLLAVGIPHDGRQTRSSILTGVMGILHVFNTGVVRNWSVRRRTSRRIR